MFHSKAGLPLTWYQSQGTSH